MKNINKIGAFTKMCCTIGNLPSSYMMSMTYEEQLLWLCNYLEKTIIPTLNGNAEAIEELQEKFNLLKSYVDNYFDNLDIQEEINNKLDEMADSGELTDIIAQYLQLAGLLIYGTLDELKNAENLANGSYCKVYGLNNINDGKSENYIIRTYTTGDVVDNDNIVALVNYPTLIAEKIIGNISYYEISNKMTQEEIQALMNLKRNKVLTFIDDEYTFNSTFRLNKNTKLVLNSATLTFDLPPVTEDWQNCHGFFNFNDDDEFLGYDGNGNIEVIGGNIIGGNFSFIHGNNVTFKGVNFENCQNNHILEMCAMSNLIIDGCTFKGTYLNADHNNENIQIESATSTSFPHLESDNPTFDDTPSKNVTIKNCKFLTPTNENYEFSNGIGTHNGSVNQTENILIENCYFDNVVKYSIQLYDFSNCIIRNNNFYKESAVLNNSIHAHLILKGTSKNICIENNTFTNNLRAIITDTPYTINENINIIRNKFLGYNLNTGWSIVEIFNGNNCTIDNNEFKDFIQPVIKIRKNGSSDLSQYANKITNNLFIGADSSTTNKIISGEYGILDIINNTISAYASGNRTAIELGESVNKPYISGNIINNMNRYSINSNVSKENIYNLCFETSQTSQLSLDDYDTGYNIFQFNTCYITLGSSANTQILDLKNFHTQDKLETRTYYLPVATSSGASYVIVTLNSNGTIDYNSNNTSLAFRKLALINETR